MRGTTRDCGDPIADRFDGNLSPDAVDLVMEWAAAHREERLEDWNLARKQQRLKRLAPLE